MGLSTLAGRTVTSARVTLPAWGIWFADASIDGEHTLTGRVEFKLADLTLSGTILSGGPEKGRSFYRIIGGAGGWGRTIRRESYEDDAGVKKLTVLRDAAAAVGETLDTSSLSASDRLGPRYTRPDGTASALLERHVSKAWYVGEDGTTRLGARPASTLPAKATRVNLDTARQVLTVASESIATILPGLVVDGLIAVDVVHELTPSGLRSTIWGSLAGGKDRALEAFRAILEQLDPFRKFRGVTEYRVVSQVGELLNLQPMLASSGMPDLPRVLVRPGVAGCRSDVALGSSVLVGFVNSDPSRPYVAGFEDADGEGFVPLLTEIDAQTLVRIGAGALPVARAGDLAGGIWPIAPTQVKVLA